MLALSTYVVSGYLVLFGFSIYFAGCTVDNTIQQNDDDGIEPSWVYKCMGDNGCHRQMQSIYTEKNTSTIYPNMDLCRSMCGRFGGLWPRPVSMVLSAQTIAFHPNYITYDLISAPISTIKLLKEMTDIITDNILAECDGNVTEMVDTPVVVYLNVKSSNTSITWDTDEHYTLDLQKKGKEISVYISAETVYGARHALETFSQLVSSSRPDFSNQKSCGLRIAAGAKIRDGPMFKHRGLVLDTSRNFIPMDDIKRMIDGMAATKMNVFHWHVTDSHSFPLESPKVPQFTRYGAYSSSEIYRMEEVAELVEYSLARGVRVMIEIDSPAHAGNGWQWGKEHGYGDLAVCVNAEPWRKLCIQPPCGQLNPANPTMYRVLRYLYRDIAEVLPRPRLFHMGGDEVFLRCWNSSEDIVNYMIDKGFDLAEDGFIRLWAEFHSTALQIWDEELKAAGEEYKQPVILWSSQLTQVNRIQNFLNKDRYVIEVWESQDSPMIAQLIGLGYRVISIPKDVWYLDRGFWGSTTYSNWRQMYSHLLPESEAVLGGEVAMWSEYVDKEGLDARIWPRAAAVAERLWSNPLSPSGAAEPRLQRLRRRLIARGLRPDVLSPAWCQQNDNKCI